jgi:hypothetical protein
MPTEAQVSYCRVLASSAHPGKWFIRLYTEGNTVIGALEHNGTKFFASEALARQIAEDQGITIVE